MFLISWFRWSNALEEISRVCTRARWYTAYFACHWKEVITAFPVLQRQCKFPTVRCVVHIQFETHKKADTPSEESVTPTTSKWVCGEGPILYSTPAEWSRMNSRHLHTKPRKREKNMLLSFDPLHLCSSWWGKWGDLSLKVFVEANYVSSYSFLPFRHHVPTGSLPRRRVSNRTFVSHR